MIDPLLAYCHKRLVCEHVPYAVEAYPEGGQRHLSGESALFVRVITEGIFGITPEGLDAFSFIPRLPKGFDRMRLSSIYISGSCFDILVEKDAWTVSQNGALVAQGKTNGEKVFIHSR